MLGGGGMTEHDGSAVTGGGGTAEQDSAVTGGGGIAEQDESAVAGGGGTAEQDSAVTGGGGIAEQDGSAVFGGGGMTDPDNDVRGGGGIAEQASAVLGGGGINDPERSGLSALARAYCPASVTASPSSSPGSDHAPDSILSILQLIRPFGKPPAPQAHPATPPPAHGSFMIVSGFGRYWPRIAHDHETGRPAPDPASAPQMCSGSSEVQTTIRVRSPRNRSRANSSGSPEWA
jgi:hypothetical protein